MDLNKERIQELKEKIFAKRQQIEFEEKEREFEETGDIENPDVTEETKNFNDRPDSAVDPNLLSSLDRSKTELNDLMRQLDELSRT